MDEVEFHRALTLKRAKFIHRFQSEPNVLYLGTIEAQAFDRMVEDKLRYRIALNEQPGPTQFAGFFIVRTGELSHFNVAFIEP